MRTSKTTAIFMILLILTLPFYSASVFAQGDLRNVKVTGADGYEGYARGENEVLKFESVACVDGQTPPISGGQVRLGGNTASRGIAFSCADNADGCSKCTLERNLYQYFEGGFCPYSADIFDINLYSSTGVFIDDEVARINCDTLPPTLSMSSTDSMLGKDDSLDIDYTIVDYACSGTGCLGRCVGIKKIDFKVGTTLIESVDISGNPNSCSYNGNIAILSSKFTEGNVVLSAVAYDNFGKPSLSKSVNFKADFTEPVITKHDFKVTDLSGNEITYFTKQDVLATLVVDITDPNLNKNSIKADFSSMNLISGSNTPSCTTVGNAYRCTWKNLKFNMDSASFVGQVVINATDTAGNEGGAVIDVSEDLEVDAAAPVISSLTITGTDGEELGWIRPGETVQAIVSVTITETGIGLNKDTVVADLSALNPSLTGMTKGVCSTSATDNTIATCTWNVVLKIDGTDTEPLSISFNATDYAGNSPSDFVTFTYTFSVDTTGPSFSSITTERQDSDDAFFIGAEGNTFEAVVVESGSGLEANNVFIDFGQIGAGVKPATSCSEESPYTCVWENVVAGVSEGTYKIRPGAGTKDNVGNLIELGEEPLEVEVVFDKTKPVVAAIDVVPVAEADVVLEDYLQYGNAMLVSALLIEANEIDNATLDASSVIDDGAEEILGTCEEAECWACPGDDSIYIEEPEDETCVEVEDCKQCTWTTSAITSGYKAAAELDFTFFDIAGNKLDDVTETITVYGVSEEESDYWEYSVLESSPKSIDRELVTIYNPYIYFPITLDSIDGDGADEQWPVYISLGDCTEGDYEMISSSYNNKPEIFPENIIPFDEDSELPYYIYFKFTMDNTAPPVGKNFTINCTLRIRTLIDQKKISAEETEKITFNINYYNNPLGTIDKNIREEIREVQESWPVNMAWWDDLNKLLHYAELTCSILMRIQQVIDMYSLVVEVFESCANIPLLSEACILSKSGAGSALYVIKGSYSTYYSNIGNKVCKIINCQLFEGPDWGGDNIAVEFFENWINSVAESRGSGAIQRGVWKPQNSLLLSVLFLCPKGVIYNLQKARVVDCNYIMCLKTVNSGTPIQECTGQRSYSYCQWVLGEIFNWIPFAAAIGGIGQAILKALSHPAEFIGFGLNAGCTVLCTWKSYPGACVSCTVIEFVNVGLDIMCDLGVGAEHCQPIWEQLTVDDSICDMALEDLPEEETTGSTSEEEEPVEGSY